MPTSADPYASLEPLSPTDRTRVRRSRQRARADRADLRALLTRAVICHLGLVTDGIPLVLPMAYGVDWSGADPYGTLYLHGSVAGRGMRAAEDRTVCVTVTEVDGLVLARSGFHHSANYGSAVILGRARLVDDPAERRRALDLIVDHLVPGRAATLRPPTRKELAATAVLALSLREASVKQRSGDPVDEPEDVANGTWAGVLPLRLATGAPITAADCDPATPVPDEVLAASALGRRAPPSAPAGETP